MTATSLHSGITWIQGTIPAVTTNRSLLLVLFWVCLPVTKRQAMIQETDYENSVSFCGLKIPTNPCRVTTHS
ncbi:MAG: hypothetical protein LBP87_02355 [Planctomycetaceae bacterium]|jgi:hypothetical protein|nr:hypothetical protein [Planctomycetaceae bacterium]